MWGGYVVKLGLVGVYCQCVGNESQDVHKMYKSIGWHVGAFFLLYCLWKNEIGVSHVHANCPDNLLNLNHAKVLTRCENDFFCLLHEMHELKAIICKPKCLPLHCPWLVVSNWPMAMCRTSARLFYNGVWWSHEDWCWIQPVDWKACSLCCRFGGPKN